MAEDAVDNVDQVDNRLVKLESSSVDHAFSHQDVNLNADQTEQLLHFQDLTGIDDIRRCRQLLLFHNWDMESAVRAQFTDPEERVHQPRQPRIDARMPIINVHPLDQRVYAIIHRRPVGIIGWGYWIVTFPFQYFYSKFICIFRFACRLLWYSPRKAVTSPLDEIKQFKQRFISTYGGLHPNFIEATYSQVANMAKQDLKFLVIYLHNNQLKQSEHLCRNVLCTTGVVEFLNSTFLVWGCDVASLEGQRVLQSLSERGNNNLWIAIMVQRHNRLTVVAKMEDFCGAPEFVQRLRQVLSDNQHYLHAATAERKELNLAHSLRQEQDEAYHLSLKADQEKEMARRRQKEQQEELDRSLQEEQQRTLDELLQRKAEARERLMPEPDANDPDSIKIMLQLPNGTRLDRRFHKSDSIRCLYYYLFVHEASPDNFRVIHDFPRRVLRCNPNSYDSEVAMPTFAEVGLGRCELLFVQDEDA